MFFFNQKHMRVILISFLLLPILLRGQSDVSGLVTDKETNTPVPGATLVFQPTGKMTVTDDFGRFIFRKISTGQYSITVRHIGFDQITTSFSIPETSEINFQLQPSSTLAETVVVKATRSDEKTPMTFSNLERQAIARQNFGQDMPYILNFTPSVVTTSDAGTGIGYTGIRIRGSDATRINVTINGIPYNDSESQGVFWVNIPDIASSVESVQIQRGVGTSGNGPGAFGATVNLQTNLTRDEPYAELIQSAGSFNSLRTTLGGGSGNHLGKFSTEGRLSFISSDGFIDRATANLKSYYFQAGYFGDKTILRAMMFGGREVTYQSWYGVPESRLKNDREGMEFTALTEGWNDEQLNHLLRSGARTFNFYTYENQVDDYGQDHFQLHGSRRFNENLTANLSLHRTGGAGYFEEFRPNETYADYGLNNITVNGEVTSTGKLVRRRWLDNKFFGTTWSLLYDNKKFQSVLGGGWNQYDGDHYGEVIKTGPSLTRTVNNPYYFNNGLKKDMNVYWKIGYDLTEKLNLFTDLQYRGIDYKAGGTENDGTKFSFDLNYNFFNPKAGVTWKMNSMTQWYGSVAVGRREPAREDLISALPDAPKPENLTDFETGLRFKAEKFQLGTNVYYMLYKDQLVLTGALNDVGAYIRTNVPRSYRLGIELDGGWRINSKIYWTGNLTLSENKIFDFTEVVYDYGEAFDLFEEKRTTFKKTTISFSPGVIAGSQWRFQVFKNGEVSVLSKFVGKQYLDNTLNESRRIDPYLVNDLRVGWKFQTRFAKEIGLNLQVNNLLNKLYASNGYTYGYFGGATEYRQNYFYPQAGRNFMLMLTAKI